MKMKTEDSKVSKWFHERSKAAIKQKQRIKDGAFY